MDKAAAQFEVSLDGFTVLVVDDDALCRLALADMLEDVGAQVEMVDGGQAALEFLDLVRPSAVVLDLQMPRMSGLELLRQIRARPALEHMPVVMVTATSDPSGARLAALEAGVDDFLGKPVEPAELSLRLRNLLRLNSYRHALEADKHTLELEVAARTSDLRQQAAVVQRVADAIVSTDPMLRVRTWNPGAESTFGVRVEEALDQPLFELLHTRWETGSERAMRHALAEEGRWTGELVQAALGGRTVRARVSVTRLDGPTGDLDGYAFVLHDLTELLQARALMAQAEARSARVQRLEALGSVTGNLAHDFNNWLGVIMSYTSLALEECGPHSALHADLKTVLDASESASSVVRQLLAFGRRQLLDPERADLNGLVRRLMRLLDRVLGANVEARLDLHEDTPEVRVDVGQIEQVLMNLVVNARDAMPDGGHLLVRTRSETLDEEPARLLDLPPGVYARVDVEDTGVGMDEATRTRVFEPFFTTKGPERGSGLGLSSVYGIVRQSGGQVEVHSCLGHGTQFSVWLPEDTSGVERRARDDRGTGEHDQIVVASRLLLVEDQPQLRSMIKRSLRGMGVEIEAVASAEAALERLEDEAPDLMITDVSMPGMGGLELAEIVRERFGRLPLLFITGYWTGTLPEDTEEDPQFLLLKPFTPKQLRRIVQGILQRYGASSSVRK